MEIKILSKLKRKFFCCLKERFDNFSNQGVEGQISLM